MVIGFSSVIVYFLIHQCLKISFDYILQDLIFSMFIFFFHLLPSFSWCNGKVGTLAFIMVQLWLQGVFDPNILQTLPCLIYWTWRLLSQNLHLLLALFVLLMTGVSMFLVPVPPPPLAQLFDASLLPILASRLGCQYHNVLQVRHDAPFEASPTQRHIGQCLILPDF